MNIQWSFDLPTSDKDEYFMYESPIYTDNSEVLFTYENRQDMKLLVIDTNTGVGKELSLKSSVRLLSKKISLLHL